MEFAAEIGTSPGGVNKWISGENTPNFESCLRIALHFDVDPIQVFKMAERLDYVRLYRRHVESLTFHHELHARLQALLDVGLSEEVDRKLRQIEDDRPHLKSKGRRTSPKQLT